MKLNKKIISLVASLGVVAMMHASTAVALPDHARIITYYSDATLSVEVGQGGNGCQHAFHYGETTPYYTVEEFDCF